MVEKILLTQKIVYSCRGGLMGVEGMYFVKFCVLYGLRAKEML